MRILHTECSRNWGGQEFRVLEQLVWLNENGYFAALAAPPGSPLLVRACNLGLPAVALRFRGNGTPNTVWKLYGLVRQWRIEVLDAHGGRDSAAAVWMKGCCAVVRTLHVVKRIKKGWWRAWRWRRGCHHVIATADKIREQLSECGCCPPGGISVVGEWADDEFFRCGMGEKGNCKIREELGLGEHDVLFLNVGMLRPDKGQRYFIEAARIYRERYGTAYFAIAGEATNTEKEYAEKLKRLVSRLDLDGCVRFLGYREDVADLMGAADAVVVASVAVEAQSRVVPQAFAVGTPVVATHVGGLPELVRDGDTGYLVPPSDGEAIAGALHKIVSNPADSKRLVVRARDLAEQEFTLRHRMEQTLEAYAKAIRARRVQ